MKRRCAPILRRRRRLDAHRNLPRGLPATVPAVFSSACRISLSGDCSGSPYHGGDPGQHERGERVKQRIAVIGAGAVGGYVGGHLARNGYDVTLIDPWP
ncbi:MAG: 2-dehydropantoate 2-reductase N-terminal domain-containing protein, partial [Acetobacteraceae bacterium]